MPYDDDGGNRRWLHQHLGEHIRPQLVLDSRGVWGIARDHLRHLVDGLADRFGRVDVFLDYRGTDTCERRCRDARGDDCVCSCLGQNHGGAQFWCRWREVSQTTLVAAGVRRHIMVTPAAVPDSPGAVVPVSRQPSADTRIWLDVPFADKDQAKQAGARWDQKAKRWYAPHAGIDALSPWLAVTSVPDLLPGEDRSLGSGLFVDLVPSSCWFTNVRSCVAPKDWERLRRMITARAGHACEVCGATPDPAARMWLEVHERWTFDPATQVQRLGRLICLCTPCHTVTHFGFATVRGRDREALDHLIAVTGMTGHQAQRHIDEAFRVWQARSRTTWSLDLSILTDAGVILNPPPDANQRADAAKTTLNTTHSPPW